MATLLQTLLKHSLNLGTDSVLDQYIETVLPPLEQEFSTISVLSSLDENDRCLPIYESSKAIGGTAKNCANYLDQSLPIQVLNSLLIAWNLLPHLSSKLTLSDIEKRLFCIGLSLRHYNYWIFYGESISPVDLSLDEIFETYLSVGERLHFSDFWENWQNYLLEINYLAQTPNLGIGTVATAKQATFKISKRRLNLPLRPLVELSQTATQLTDSVELVTKTKGHFLQEQLKLLGIYYRLTYHRSRNYTGLLTQSIHDAVIQFVKDLDWHPILFFAQGVIYLAPKNSKLPDRIELQTFLWEQVRQQLSVAMQQGKVGFKRDGKGLKAAPQALELFSPAYLIRNLPRIIHSYVRNEKDPATPKRLKKLNLSTAEQELLAFGADLRADRLAEFIILVQAKFFKNHPEFINWMLAALNIQFTVTPEQTQLQSGGVFLGWYYAAAHYIANNLTLDFSEALQVLADELANWAEVNHLLPVHQNSTRDVFYDYVTQYLEVQGWDVPTLSFQKELAGYVNAKTKAAKQPICSLSSGEFISEDQTDSVVLFKPQQYSNKNPLGGRQIKRGISKIWSLEMLLRQAVWSVSAGKLEEQHPVFLYVLPAHLHTPQAARSISLLTKQIQSINLWEVRRYWLASGMNVQALQTFPWLKPDQDEGCLSTPGYLEDSPFIAISYFVAKSRTNTEAWIKPIFLALALPMFFCVKVVATSSSVPPFHNNSDFQECARLDGPADFWSMLNLPTTLHFKNWINGRVQTLAEVLNRLMVVYSLHLDIRSDPPDACWKALNMTVQALSNDILNIFQLAAEKLRRDNTKHKLTTEEVHRFWRYAQIWAGDDVEMQGKLKVTRQLASECYKFYRVAPYASSHSILLPLSKALEQILAVPADWDNEEIINQGAGLLKAALDRQEIYKRPLMVNKAIDYEVRQLQEMEAIQTFMTTCVNQLFGEMCQGDRALLQENRNQIKAGVEFAYCQLALQERQAKANSKQGDEHEYS